jgi:hypothetical protein
LLLPSVCAREAALTRRWSSAASRVNLWRKCGQLPHSSNPISPLVHIKNASKDVLFNAPMLAFNVSDEKLNEFCAGNADHKLT